ncbi:MAG: class I SAM-dependent methyltransferase [Myxococcaceae bacterium]|nr:class I SAM-dependent methyltransferase [Myxococcaceae bacterium]MCI0669478.1 class I SAM-dependent methyltransferase [Myxococcaceae bacterium]
MSPDVRSALSLFQGLPFAERMWVRGRLATAPLAEVARHVPAGRVADVGCGHGLLTALLAAGRADRHVLGVDPDPRKVQWAKASVGALPNVELREGSVEQLDVVRDGGLDAIVVADVLYLLPLARWEGFLGACHRLLRPGGRLVLKEMEADRSWKHVKAVAQEALVVHLLRRTHSSGGLTVLPRSEMEALLARAGFAPEQVVSLGRGYTTPHVLYVAKREA